LRFLKTISSIIGMLLVIGMNDAAAAENEAPVTTEPVWPKYEFSARLMTGFEVEHETPEGSQGGDEKTDYSFFLQQARLKVKILFSKNIKLNLSADLSDAIDLLQELNEVEETKTVETLASCDAIDFIGETKDLPFLRNAYMNLRIHDAFQIRAGRYKQPFSRLENQSTGRLAFRGRGLSNGTIIEDARFGGRGLGAMFWGRIKKADITWHASATNPSWDVIKAESTNGVNALARLEWDPKKWISIGVNGGYQWYQYTEFDEDDVPGAGLAVFGGDVRFKKGGFYAAAEAIAGGRHVVSPRHVDTGECIETRERSPFAFGVTAHASYRFTVARLLDLQPVVFGEYADSDMDYSKTEAIRAVVGFNFLVGEHLRIMPQAEIIHPLDVTNGAWDDPIIRPVNEWEASETYYLMVALEL
jgi:Phosphate-selective porin O and P